MTSRFAVLVALAFALVAIPWHATTAEAADVNITLIASGFQWHRNSPSAPPQPTIQINAGDQMLIQVQNDDLAFHTFTFPHFSVDQSLPAGTVAFVNITTTAGDVGTWQFWCQPHSSGTDPEAHTGMVGWVDIQSVGGPDTTPPTIAHTPVTTATAGTPITIHATASDDVQLQEVRLNFTDVSGVSHNVTMTLDGTEYHYDIPAQPSAGTVTYFVYAEDTSSNWAMTNPVTVSVAAAADYTWLLVGGAVLLVALLLAALFLRKKK